MTDLNVIDARNGEGQPHECRGVWKRLGENLGGHDIYRCSAESPHYLIAAHDIGEHACGDGCESTFTGFGTEFGPRVV